MQDFIASLPWQSWWSTLQGGAAQLAARPGALAGLALLIALWAGWRAGVASRRARALERLLRGQARHGAAPSALDDEAALADLAARLERLEAAGEQVDRRLGELAEELARCIRHVAVVRFNAFDNTGGEQSFVLALLDGHGNGAVITTLAGREESRTYAKPIAGGSSSYLLSEEEQEAIRRALGAGPALGRVQVPGAGAAGGRGWFFSASRRDGR